VATVVTTVGKTWIRDKLLESVSTAAKWLGWGTGGGTAAAGDTDLFTPATEARTVGVESSQSTDTYRVVGTLTADGTKTITNAGTFNAVGSGSPPSGGGLVVHGDHTGIALLAGDSIQYTIDIQVT